MKKEIADNILHETEVGYDSISKKFSQTRKHFWRGLEYLRDYAGKGSTVLDYGCGNGRLLELIGDVPNLEYHGLDTSGKLIEFASQQYSAPGRHFSKIDPSQTSLAFEDNFFNTIYSIAVFHHFPSEEYRKQIASQFYRTTSDGGYIIVTVWYLWQRKYLKNILTNWFDKVKGKSKLDWNDCLISFTDNDGKKFQRFHHAFTKRELADLFAGAGFKIEQCEIVDGRNIVLVAHK